MVDCIPDYELKRTRRKTVEIRIYADATVQVRAPLNASRREIDRWVSQRSAWINNKLATLENLPPVQPRYAPGQQILLLGQTRTITWQEAERKNCYLQPDTLEVHCSGERQNQIPQQVEKFIRDVARETFERIIDMQFGWFSRQGHVRPTLRVKRMKTRWGSLSERGYINLNMELVHRPVEAMEYVIMHELCHLEFMHHGPEFHQLMDIRMPDWRVRKKLL